MLWAVALAAARRRPGLFRAESLGDASAHEVAEILRVDGETVADPERRAALWRDLADGIQRDHGGEAWALLAACGRRLGGDDGLLALLSRYEAYADPLQKKSFLFAKIAERRGWLAVADPEHWEVSADSVLMRLALRSGLVDPGTRDEVRAATRDAFKAVAHAAGISPPVLDDLLWEQGRHYPDLLGDEAGDLWEPPRDSGSAWY